VNPAPAAAPDDVVAVLRRRGQTLAVAESLTGGELCSRLVGVPGVSAVLRGGVVAYATDLKGSLLGVDGDLLARHGAVHPEVAGAMARGAAARLGADWGVATTGVAGPQPQDGHPPGTVHVAVHGPDGPGACRVITLALDGDRAAVRTAAVAAALDLLVVLLSA
jgi:nicotinamide-nucleotide amidase